ncbi:MAG: MBL fold metallo-hydrolase, partial [Lachnospiraceae bacterium]|nr:MBL fold metallo-hydrolase [Lachnospiraceae bacterium]
IFHKNVESCFDEEAMELVRQGINPIRFPGLKVAVTSDESKLINFDAKPKVIISASGMCEAGRIRHHLKHNLWRADSTILFVGYQAVGTLGRSLLEGVPEVKLFGETIEVRAKIEKLDGISGHADKEGLMTWLRAFDPMPKVFVVHGEDSVCDAFTEYIRTQYGYDAEAPYSGGVYDVIADEWLAEGVTEKKRRQSAKAKRASDIFERLVAAGKRLMVVISHNEGGANKDLVRFADQINSLCDKWDR